MSEGSGLRKLIRLPVHLLSTLSAIPLNIIANRTVRILREVSQGIVNVSWAKNESIGLFAKAAAARDALTLQRCQRQRGPPEADLE